MRIILSLHSRITRDDLFDYVHTHYTAPRVVVAGAGSINHQDVEPVSCSDLAGGDGREDLRSPSCEAHERSHRSSSDEAVHFLDQDASGRRGGANSLQDDKYPFCSIAVAFEAEGWSHADALVFMIIQTVVGQWNRMSGAGTNLPSAFCSTVAHEDLAHSVSTFFTCYKDTSLFGVYSECPKETIPRLMEVTMQVGTIRCCDAGIAYGL